MYKKTIISLGLVGFVALAASRFPWPTDQTINCEVREMLGSQKTSTVTKSINLQIRDDQYDKSAFLGELVKDVKVNLSINRASLNLFKVFDRQFVIPSWQITQVFEDLQSGSKTTGITVVTKILGDFRTAEFNFFERSNGDFVGTVCSLD